MRTVRGESEIEVARKLASSTPQWTTYTLLLRRPPMLPLFATVSEIWARSAGGLR